jgi:hypothetical protein
MLETLPYRLGSLQPPQLFRNAAVSARFARLYSVKLRCLPFGFWRAVAEGGLPWLGFAAGALMMKPLAVLPAFCG